LKKASPLSLNATEQTSVDASIFNITAIVSICFSRVFVRRDFVCNLFVGSRWLINDKDSKNNCLK
jgi:hypothetical protein